MDDKMTRQQLSFPAPVEGAPDARFAGFLYRATASRRNVLQVAVHGTSYDHRYWDAGVINGGQDYSYVRYMTARGFDVLAVDLPGVGASDKPDGHSISVRAVGQALSSLISSLRKPGVIPGLIVERVASVGHSLGSNVAVFAEANWPAADVLVVTATGYYPERPRRSWAPGEREAMFAKPYALVPKESRRKFYHSAQADPDVIVYDNEVLRTEMPSGLWSDCVVLSNDPAAAGVEKVECPVYLQLGEHDPTLPGRYAEQERACYRGSVEVIAEALPDMGHAFNLHLNREQSWERICAYLDR